MNHDTEKNQYVATLKSTLATLSNLTEHFERFEPTDRPTWYHSIPGLMAEIHKDLTIVERDTQEHR